MVEKNRICVLSFRSKNTHVSRCNDYEFEDVILSVDDADLLTIEQGPLFSLRKRLVNQSLRHVSPLFSRVSPSFTRIYLKKNYDLFFVVCEDITDVLAVNSIRNWERHCAFSVCWIDEAWLASLEINRRLCKKILSRFDYVFTGCKESVERLQELVQKPCRYMPPGVDMYKFLPSVRPKAERDIDIYSIGRRPPMLHKRLLSLELSKGINYIYDDVSSSNLYVLDYLGHRDKIRNNLNRSKFFIVFPSKFDVPGQTRGQIEFGFRFFEGAASGAVLIGNIPDSEVFREIFYWQDAVIPLPKNTDDLYQLLDALGKDKERMERIAHTNICQCLNNHDWTHRWRSILESVGLEVGPRLQQRERALGELAGHYDLGCQNPSNHAS
jgi:spore maturation protein CgeB